MYKNCLCGANTGHTPGFIHKTDSAPHHLILHFKTPFFCIVNGKRLEGSAGDCIIHRKGDKIIHGPLRDDEQFINDWLYFESDEDLSSLPYDVLITADQDEVIGELIEYILLEKTDSDKRSKRLISETIYRITTILERAHERSEKDSSSDAIRFRNARRYILTHFSENWTLAKMAALTGYSVSRFSAKYHEYFSMSPMDDLLDKRFKTAKKMLLLPTYKIGEIASMCGFSSIHYFSRFFKSHTGLSPNEYSKQTLVCI